MKVIKKKKKKKKVNMNKINGILKTISMNNLEMPKEINISIDEKE